MAASDGAHWAIEARVLWKPLVMPSTFASTWGSLGDWLSLPKCSEILSRWKAREPRTPSGFTLRCAESSQFKVGSQSTNSTLLAYSSIPMTQAVTNEVPVSPPDEPPCQQSLDDDEDDVQEVSQDDDVDRHKLELFHAIHVVGQNARALVDEDDVDEGLQEDVIFDHTFEFLEDHAHYGYFSTFVLFKGLDPDPKSVAQTPCTFPL